MDLIQTDQQKIDALPNALKIPVTSDKIINSNVVSVPIFDPNFVPASKNDKQPQIGTSTFVQYDYISNEMETSSTPYFNGSSYSSAEYLKPNEIAFYATPKWFKDGSNNIYRIKKMRPLRWTLSNYRHKDKII